MIFCVLFGNFYKNESFIDRFTVPETTCILNIMKIIAGFLEKKEETGNV